MWETAIKYHSDHRKQRYELAEKPKKKKFNRIFINVKLAIKVIMSSRATSFNNLEQD